MRCAAMGAGRWMMMMLLGAWCWEPGLGVRRVNVCRRAREGKGRLTVVKRASGFLRGAVERGEFSEGTPGERVDVM